jgi:hypothetical protein
VPDVSDALFKVLAKVYARDGASGGGDAAAASSGSSQKRALAGGLAAAWWPAKRNLMAKVRAKTPTVPFEMGSNTQPYARTAFGRVRAWLRTL